MKNVALIILIAITIASCGSSKQVNYDGNTTGWDHDAVKNGGYLFESSGKTDQETSFQQERKVIYDAALSLRVKNPDSVNVKLKKVASNYNGYVLSLGNYQSVIRVNAGSLDAAVKEIATFGKLNYKNISGDDVTDQYMDYQIRLENATTARKRYMELLEKAENVAAALLVEKELERLNGEIDILEGKMKKISHLSEFSTITVTMEKKVKPGILGYVFVGLYEGVKWLFVRN